MVVGAVSDSALPACEYHRTNEAVSSSEVLEALCVQECNLSFPARPWPSLFLKGKERERASWEFLSAKT